MDCLNNNTSLTYDTDLGRAYEKILKALEYLKNSDDFMRMVLWNLHYPE